MADPAKEPRKSNGCLLGVAKWNPTSTPEFYDRVAPKKFRIIRSLRMTRRVCRTPVAFAYCWRFGNL